MEGSMKNSIRLVFVVLLLFGFFSVFSPVDPLFWAFVYGWCKKNDLNYVGYTGKKWDKDYGIIEGRCNSVVVGVVFGGVIGGVVGSCAVNKEDRPVAIVVGTILNT